MGGPEWGEQGVAQASTPGSWETGRGVGATVGSSFSDTGVCWGEGAEAQEGRPCCGMWHVLGSAQPHQAGLPSSACSQLSEEGDQEPSGLGDMPWTPAAGPTPGPRQSLLKGCRKVGVGLGQPQFCGSVGGERWDGLSAGTGASSCSG